MILPRRRLPLLLALPLSAFVPPRVDVAGPTVDATAWRVGVKSGIGGPDGPAAVLSAWRLR
jgi:hypothetical protein